MVLWAPGCCRADRQHLEMAVLGSGYDVGPPDAVSTWTHDAQSGCGTVARVLKPRDDMHDLSCA